MTRTGDVAAPTPSRALRGGDVLRDPLVAELLDARLVAVLATLDPGGAIHAVPLWFAHDGDAIVLATGSRSRKVRNVERDPKATLVLHDSRSGLEVCGASIQGRVELVRGAAAEPFVELVHSRYVTKAGERIEPVAEFLASDDLALLLRPDSAVTWDERQSSAAHALRASGQARPLVPTTPGA